jgi:hypothetical protein
MTHTHTHIHQKHYLDLLQKVTLQLEIGYKSTNLQKDYLIENPEYPNL